MWTINTSNLVQSVTHEESNLWEQLSFIIIVVYSLSLSVRVALLLTQTFSLTSGNSV